MTNRPTRLGAMGVLWMLGASGLAAQDHSATYVSPVKGEGNFAGRTDRTLRYRPDGGDFVIENGNEFFNRPLYGQPAPFRVDGGDQPEFSFYAPGQAGNLRLGLRTPAGAKWLFEAQRRVTRYRAGALVYEIRDPLLGDAATLVVTALPTSTVEGLVVRAELQGQAPKPVDLVWAFGGAGGKRGRRSGDIGTEEVPISQFFQLNPQSCQDNRFSLQASGFELQSKIATLRGLVPAGARLAIGDCQNWQTPGAALANASPSAKTDRPMVIARVPLRGPAPTYFAIVRAMNDAAKGTPGAGAASSAPATAHSQLLPADLPRLYSEADNYRRSIAGQVTADTPDPYVNAALPALLTAANGIWDEKQNAFMHGAVAWRSKLLGWRGPYSGDALGWHDRARRHFNEWAQRQNTSPVPASLPAQDPTVNLARNEPALHTNGDLSKSHYDMNLVYIDALLRHVLWTGDINFVREMWPMLERHFAWEQRSFRRPFGEKGLPLYEGYAAIWASDDLEYHGGGSAHASAYNYYHNLMAARLARKLQQDVAPYENEAAQILAAMREHLWMADRGWYGEWRDALGLKLLHPNAALWSIYHTIDSEVADPQDAWQMTRYVDTQIPHIPLSGSGVPEGHYTLATTRWMPYTWSINNVVMAEAVHTALAYWQANRSDEAFRLFKGALLDSMYTGLCPGNVGMTTGFDMARREAQRDFGDSIGVLSRAFVEGLFGVRPNALDGELLIKPGFPVEWTRAALKHPDFLLEFKREQQADALVDRYVIEPKWSRPMALRMQAAAPLSRVASVTVNGSAARWESVDDAVETARIEIKSEPAMRYEIEIEWRGTPPAYPAFSVQSSANAAQAEAASGNAQARGEVSLKSVALGDMITAQFGEASVVKVADPQRALADAQVKRDAVSGIASGQLGHRSLFAQLKQNDLTWWAPVAFEIRPAIEVLQTAAQSFKIRNNSASAVETSWLLGGTSQSDAYAATNPVPPLRLPALSESEAISLSGNLLPGTHRVSVVAQGTRIEAGTFTSWGVNAPASVRWRTVNLASRFNDRVTQIFRNEYLSPRPQRVSLSIPKQGYGSWAHWDATFDVDDSGLREAAKRGGGRITAAGIPFETPVTENTPNIVFTSRWDNYPPETTVSISGKSSHAYLLMAGSTNWMQSRFDNGEVIITYVDGPSERLPLNNPVNWWPIDQDYFIDDFAFSRPEPIPPRVHLKTGETRITGLADMKGRGGRIPGGAATVLDVPLDPSRSLKSLTLRTLSNEVVIGLMAVTLVDAAESG